MAKTTWRNLIAEEMALRGETWADVEACTLGDWGLERPFDDGYGGIEGAPFTLWTKARVHFPVGYDGAEWVGSVPRHPCGKASEHIGGG